MAATKVTLLFNGGTVDAVGNAARLAGYSESYYSTLALDANQLKVNWQALCIARAAILPSNVRIIGSRYQTVDPVGASRSYDNSYAGAVIANELPGIAMQFTVRSANTTNQRSLILRGVPDARVVTGEYSPVVAYNQALINFFGELQGKWQFRAIDRTILPVKIKDIIGDGTMTTFEAHGLVAGDKCNIMSTRADSAHKKSYLALVIERISATVVKIIRADNQPDVLTSVGGRVRKVAIIYPNFSITPEEIIQPTIIHRKVGSPFKKFRGRRTVQR